MKREASSHVKLLDDSVSSIIANTFDIDALVDPISTELANVIKGYKNCDVFCVRCTRDG